ncbi:hypothetical protein Q648_00754 [Bartonella quintana JK 12]|nr:hypothetical protein Q647_01165 [Bartonella quintana JK 7]ETS19046.1 hypothetical protein Q648_00754 [Bartonella quintana JK 12]
MEKSAARQMIAKRTFRTVVAMVPVRNLQILSTAPIRVDSSHTCQVRKAGKERLNVGV